MKATQQYLQRHAEPETALLSSWTQTTQYHHVVLIPSFDEPYDFCERLIQSQLQPHNALAIVIVNRPDSTAANNNNLDLLSYIHAHYSCQWQNQNLALFGGQHWGLLLVDREAAPIPAKQGVGLARKIGADLACALHQLGHLKSRWIHSTDADAYWPANYFHAAAENQQACALSYDFTHRDYGCDISAATQLYEMTLRHYRDGLQAAGSPYAFFTLGSTLAIDIHAYAKVRGFPKRSGGEDFYLLNKLAKVGAIASVSDAVIELEPRMSNRVPFGTGPATQKILQTPNWAQSPTTINSYHPYIFTELQQWLTLAKSVNYCAASLKQHLTILSHDSQQGLQHIGIDKLWPHLEKHSGASQFHGWFDGFRTLKFIHFLQNSAYPPQPIVTRLLGN